MMSVRKREYDSDDDDVKPRYSNEDSKPTGVPSKKQKLFFDPQYTITLEPSEFRLVTFKSQSNKYRRCLCVFMTAERKYCFEYYWNSQQRRFYCAGCRMRQKNNTAIMEDGCTAKTEDKLHDCEPVDYETQRYVELEIIRQPNFDILEKRDPDGSKYLVVFPSDDFSHCHQYKCKKGQPFYQCCGCETMSARIWENTENEKFVELYDLKNEGEHECETIEYNPEKFYHQKSSVVVVVGKKEDHRGSSKMDEKKIVGKRDVKSPTVESSKDIILRPPDCLYMDLPEFHLPKLFIFDKEDPSMCYTLTPFKVGDGKKFYCISCDWHKRKPEAKAEMLSKGKEVKGVVTAHLFMNEEDEEDYYIKMFDDRQHLCKPKKYDPEKYMIKADTYFGPSEFFLFSYKKKPNILLAAIYNTATKKTCRIFRCAKRTQGFTCTACQKQKTFVSARCFMNAEDGSEYFKVKQTPHICSPVSVPKLKRSGIIVLKESGLNLAEEKKVDESKIIRKPDFELQNVETPDQRLIIFCDPERTLCYKYSYSKYRNQYWCLGCTRAVRNIKVKATLHVDDEDEESYIVLGEREHVCEPIKYEPEKADIVTTNFTVLNREAELLQKLVIFTSPSKELCYIYHKHGTIFRCTACFKEAKKSISARICTSEYGEEYLKLFTTNHVCEPKPYEEGEIESKVFSESDYMLLPGSKGTPNVKLIIFDREKEDHMYEFRSKSKNQYLCVQCIKFKETTIAKIKESSNGEKYVIVDKEHCCASVKYDPEKYQQKKVMYDNFVLLPSSTKDNVKKLIVFDEKNGEKCFGYEFIFQRHCNTFLCNGCDGTPVRAKLKIDKDDKEFIEIGARKHSCFARNFKDHIVKAPLYKYVENIENEQKMITVSNANMNTVLYELIYDEKFEAYSCLKCKDKGKFVAAVPAKNKNGEEYLLLNKPHICNS